MCGIAGIWNKNGSPVDQTELDILANSMRHRGPDAQGTKIRTNIGFAHTRLKIIDLSDHANQPFTDGDDILIFNGEIFNFINLKKKLPSHIKYETKSDTEVLFRFLQYYGSSGINDLEGQYSFCFFNKSINNLLIARDHVGIVPLYFMNDDRRLVFSSEIKPLLKLKKTKINPSGVIDYFSFRYNIQNGRTLFEDIKRFNPGYFWEIDLNSKSITSKRYWRLAFKNSSIGIDNLQNKFNSVLNDEIKNQSISDVPIGMYLSGGIDSGALLNGFSKTSSKINAFTIMFDKNDEDYLTVNQLNDDIPFSKNILPFDGYSNDVIDDTILSLEEPFGDLIICANYLLAEFASKQVKVVLSGEGGDESFMGYDHQRAFLKMSSYYSIPGIRSILSFLLKSLSPSLISFFNGYPGNFGIEEKNRIYDTYSNLKDPFTAYTKLISLFQVDEIQLLINEEFLRNTNKMPDHEPLKEIFSMDDNIYKCIMRAEIEQMTLIINLLKQERLGMAFSLEGRVPLVSKKILDFASSLPLDELYAKVNKKFLISYSNAKQVKKRPFSILNDPKYSNQLNRLVNNYVNESKVNESGILSWSYVEKIKASMKNKGMLGIKKMMAIFIFLKWYDKYKVYLR
tara:strand:- start:14358 stop:16229 length:1872 start_codon:yes stop_codon:yes gene_type:complete